MDNFFRYFYQDIGQLFNAFVDLLTAIWNVLNYFFNYPKRIEVIKQYDGQLSTFESILVIFVNFILIALAIVILVFLFKLFKKIIRVRISPKKYDEVVKQVRSLQRVLMRANYEKD